jgi:hypothetical protein
VAAEKRSANPAVSNARSVCCLTEASKFLVRKFASENELHCVVALLYSILLKHLFAAALCCRILSNILIYLLKHILASAILVNKGCIFK